MVLSQSKSVRRGRPAKAAQRKRRSGRPSRASAQVVGRDTLIDVVCDLLKEHPPHVITRVAVAERAGVDPSLIRYYFSDHNSMLVAATEKFAHLFDEALQPALARAGEEGMDRVLARAGALLTLEVAYPFFNRLIHEEVVDSQLPAARDLLDRLTRRAVGAYRNAIDAGVAAGTMRPVDPLFLHIAVIGLCATYVASRSILQYAKSIGIAKDISVDAYREFILELLRAGLRPLEKARRGG